MLRVESICTYPLTGGYRNEKVAAFVDLGGLQDDRELLLYTTNEDGVNIRFSQKQSSKLATVKTAFGGYDDKFWHMIMPFEDGVKNIDVSVDDAGEEVMVDEFGDATECFDMGDEHSNAFSEFLGKSVRLAQKSFRWQNGDIGPEFSERKNAPLHLVSLATVREIQSLTPDTNMVAEQLRYSILLESDGEPYEEMGWIGKDLMLGSAQIRVHRGTGRCKVTGHNQETGVNKKDVPKIWDNMPHLDLNGKSTPIIGVYGYPVRESSLAVGQEGGIWGSR